MNEIVAIVATNALAVAIVGYLIRVWIDRRLEHSLSQELEKFKAELTKEVTRHSVQITWNHSKRMELFARVYEHMVDADLELKLLLMNIKIGKRELIQDRAHKFSEKYLEVNACLHKNELFLEEVLVEEVRAVYKPYVELAHMAMADRLELEEVRSHLPKRLEDISAIGDGPRKYIVALFRKHAGLSE